MNKDEVSVILPERCLIYDRCFREIERYVLICAGDIIDIAMSEKNANWFSSFWNAEKQLIENQKNNETNNAEKQGDGSKKKTNKLPVIDEKKIDSITSIKKMDFQGIIKIFKYRKKQISHVYNKYPQCNSPEFNTLLETLIANRNSISAHLSIESIETMKSTSNTKEEEMLLFEFRHAVMHLIDFLEFFPEFCGDDGKSYLEKAKKSKEETERILNAVQYPIETVINDENLGISPAEFFAICNALYINTRSEKGKSYFYSDDYNRSIHSIKSYYELMKENDKNSKNIASDSMHLESTVHPQKPIIMSKKTKREYNPYVILFAFLVGIILLLIVIIFTLSGKNNDEASEDSNNIIGVEQTLNTNDNSSNNNVETSSLNPDNFIKFKGEASFDGLIFTVDQKESNVFTVEYKNDEQSAYSLGWVNSSQIVIETSETTYYGTILASHGGFKIAKDEQGKFKVALDEEVEGKVKRIVIQDIIPLDDGGLPAIPSTVGKTVKINITYYQ